MALIFAVDPIGKPRMTQRDRWKKRPAVLAYHAYRDAVRAQAKGWTPGGEVALVFYLPMPKSWSKAKRERMNGTEHTSKPDLDNLIKAFFDCFGEDKQVWRVQAEKIWSVTGSIEAH